MNRLITRLQRRSRVAVGSTMALIVSLPLGATIGLAATATAAPSPATATADTPAKKASEGSEKAGTTSSAATIPSVSAEPGAPVAICRGSSHP